MDGFLAKPVNPDELRQTVERLALLSPPAFSHQHPT
jgi:CheY-like chemotaxis protein